MSELTVKTDHHRSLQTYEPIRQSRELMREKRGGWVLVPEATENSWLLQGIATPQGCQAARRKTSGPRKIPQSFRCCQESQGMLTCPEILIISHRRWRRLNAWTTKDRTPSYTVRTVCFWGKRQGEDRPAGGEGAPQKAHSFPCLCLGCLPLPISARVKSNANSDKEKPFVPE